MNHAIKRLTRQHTFTISN